MIGARSVAKFSFNNSFYGIVINLDSIAQRGEKLELLVEKTDDLNATVSVSCKLYTKSV